MAALLFLLRLVVALESSSHSSRTAEFHHSELECNLWPSGHPGMTPNPFLFHHSLFCEEEQRNESCPCPYWIDPGRQFCELFWRKGLGSLHIQHMKFASFAHSFNPLAFSMVPLLSSGWCPQSRDPVLLPLQRGNLYCSAREEGGWEQQLLGQRESGKGLEGVWFLLNRLFTNSVLLLLSPLLPEVLDSAHFSGLKETLYVNQIGLPLLSLSCWF